MQASQEDFESLSIDSLTTTLGVELHPVGMPDATRQQEMEWAAISIEGSWTGDLLIGCDRNLLQTGAQQLFGIAADEASEEDRTDVAKELVNIVGGNLAPLLGEGCSVSLPKTGATDVTGATVTASFGAADAQVVVGIVPKS